MPRHLRTVVQWAHQAIEGTRIHENVHIQTLVQLRLAVMDLVMPDLQLTRAGSSDASQVVQLGPKRLRQQAKSLYEALEPGLHMLGAPRP